MTVEKTLIQDNIYSFKVKGPAVSFCAVNLGCTITNIFVKDKYGREKDVVLGYDGIEDYKKGNASFGAIVGRVANRISGASFELDGVRCYLDKNNGSSCLHGGFDRYEKKIFEFKTFCDETKAGIQFFRMSPDGEQGFPGNLELSVTYTLTSDGQLILEYEGKTDKATPVSLTNHTYFNLSGEKTILEHNLVLDCDRVLECNSDLTVTGKIKDVKDGGKIFDFSVSKKIGLDIKKIDSKVRGYDHCFITRGCQHPEVKEPVYFGTLSSEAAAIKMDIFTNQNGVHIYSGNFLDGERGKGGIKYERHAGICFETENFPDAVNHPEFPDSILRPGRKYNSKTIYKFSGGMNNEHVAE
ncbi:MAG: galactose mutarotase [Treponema sp.]|nr:galactose mutarotase [Treponema sp.]MBR0487803.1 galactose mutarotase [Treponema sp.]